MCEARKDALRVDFDRLVSLESHGSTISGDGGLLAYRQLDEEFGISRHFPFDHSLAPPAQSIVYVHRLHYQAGSWNKQHTVVAKAQWHQEESFPRVGFVFTNMRGGAKPVIDFYNRRGQAKQSIKQGKAP